MKCFGALFLFLCITSSAWAQSEFGHGPRAGTVIGTGNVHAEILRGPGAGYRVFFIDASWNDVKEENVTVKASLKSEKAKTPTALTCTPEGPGYKCEMPKGVSAANGDTVTFTRSTKDGKSQEFDYTVRPPEPTPTPWGM